MNSMLEQLHEKPCDGYLSLDQIDADVIREMFSIALKHILDMKHWDHSEEIRNFRKYKGVDLRDHPFVGDLHRHFLAVPRDDLLQNDALNKCIRHLIGWKSGLARRHVKRRIRKKKVNRVCNDFRLRYMRSPKYDRQIRRGLLYFKNGVIGEFLIPQAMEDWHG